MKIVQVICDLDLVQTCHVYNVRSQKATANYFPYFTKHRGPFFCPFPAWEQQKLCWHLQLLLHYTVLSANLGGIVSLPSRWLLIESELIKFRSVKQVNSQRINKHSNNSFMWQSANINHKLVADVCKFDQTLSSLNVQQQTDVGG